MSQIEEFIDVAKKIDSEKRVIGEVNKPENHPDAISNCEVCNGDGWRQSKKFDNRWFICYCVSNKLLQEKIKNIDEKARAAAKPDLSMIGLREDELNLNWSMVKPNISDGMKGVNAVKPAYELGHGFIMLHGSYGQAKTLIGKILVSTALRDGKKPAYANVSSVLDNIRLAFDDPEHKTTELLRRIDWWISRDVLFLDELDKNNDTQWARERLFQLLDQRYVHAVREESLTVIASNGSDKELDGYLQSRLHDKRIHSIVYLNGNDGRKVMPKGYKY